MPQKHCMWQGNCKLLQRDFDFGKGFRLMCCGHHFMCRLYRGTHKMCMSTFGLTVGLDVYGAGL